MPSRSSVEDLSRKANFVFHGRVKKLKAASMPGVNVTDRTAVVTVNEILHGPAILSGYAGKDITVQLSGRDKMKAGEEAVFFTNPTTYGESIQVESLGHHPVDAAAPALRAARGAKGDPVRTLANRDMKARFDGSDLVISGRVTSVSLPPGAEEEDEEGGAVSEHDPLWRDAVIKVQAVHKGNHSGKDVVVRFASSEDVKWYASPKFHVGQEGYFMVRKERVKTRRGRCAETVEAYTALSPFDFQPSSDEGGINIAGFSEQKEEALEKALRAVISTSVRIELKGGPKGLREVGV